MKPEFKVEGTSLFIKIGDEIGMDRDGDGVMSIKGKFNAELEANGLELADELLKSAEILKYLKEKLGL